MSEPSQRTRHDLAVVLVGHMGRLAIGLISSVLLARGLGPAGLSIFSVLGGALGIALALADWGLSTTAVTQLASAAPADAPRIAGSYARLKLLAALPFLAAPLLAAGPVAALLGIEHPQQALLVQITALSLLATTASSIVSTLLRAQQRFSHLVRAQMASISLTVLLLGALQASGRLGLASALLVGILAALLAALLGARALPPAWRGALLRPTLRWGAEGSRLLATSRWLALSAALSLLLGQLDLFLLNRWLPAPTVGQYALALNLTYKAAIVNQTLHLVLLPQVSRLQQRPRLIAYLRQTMPRSVLLVGAMALLLPLARPAILGLYGYSYAPSVGLFYGLMSVLLLDLLTLPALLVAYPLNLPRLIVASESVGLLLLALGAWWAVPLWGPYGAIGAKLAAKALSVLLLALAIGHRLNRLDAAPLVP